MHDSAARELPPDPTQPLPSISYVQAGDQSARARVIDLIERISGRRAVEAIYHQLKQDPFDPKVFFSRGLELAGIRYATSGADEAAIPKEGPLVFVANHPFGVIDGTILCDIASRHRGEFRILINALLCRDSDLSPYFLPIDFDDTREAANTNIRSKREALATLGRGGAILIFPAGAITTRRRGGFGPPTEFPWSTFTAKLIRRSEATVVPLFFHGTNSRLFHFASGLHEALRASLLIHEARNKIGRDFHVRVGDPLSHADLEHLDRAEMTRFLQQHTWNLGSHAEPPVYPLGRQA